jgi:hypothetical protein
MMENINNIPNKNPFKVPDNYFDEVNRKIISAVSGINTEEKKISIYNRFRTSILVAASIAGIIIISYSAAKLLTHKNVNSEVAEVLHEVSTESFIYDIDISALEEDASKLVLQEEGPDVSKNDIIDYLLKENIDISDIYEQL